MASNRGSMFSSSSVALEALVLILAYSSNALAEREKIKIKMMTKRYYDNGIIIIAQLKSQDPSHLKEHENNQNRRKHQKGVQHQVHMTVNHLTRPGSKIPK